MYWPTHQLTFHYQTVRVSNLFPKLKWASRLGMLEQKAMLNILSEVLRRDNEVETKAVLAVCSNLLKG